VEKKKHADNCAPTLLKFQDEAGSAKLVQQSLISFEDEERKQSRCTVAEIGNKQQESKPHQSIQL